MSCDNATQVFKLFLRCLSSCRQAESRSVDRPPPTYTPTPAHDIGVGWLQKSQTLVVNQSPFSMFVCLPPTSYQNRCHGPIFIKAVLGKPPAMIITMELLLVLFFFPKTTVSVCCFLFICSKKPTRCTHCFCVCVCVFFLKNFTEIFLKNRNRWLCCFLLIWAQFHFSKMKTKYIGKRPNWKILNSTKASLLCTLLSDEITGNCVQWATFVSKKRPCRKRKSLFPWMFPHLINAWFHLQLTFVKNTLPGAFFWKTRVLMDVFSQTKSASGYLQNLRKFPTTFLPCWILVFKQNRVCLFGEEAFSFVHTQTMNLSVPAGSTSCGR